MFGKALKQQLLQELTVLFFTGTKRAFTLATVFALQ